MKSMVEEFYGVGLFETAVGEDIAGVVALVDKLNNQSAEEGNIIDQSEGIAKPYATKS